MFMGKISVPYLESKKILIIRLRKKNYSEETNYKYLLQVTYITMPSMENKNLVHQFHVWYSLQI